MKKCTGTIYKINNKKYCVGEKNKRKSRKGSKKVKLKNTRKII